MSESTGSYNTTCSALNRDARQSGSLMRIMRSAVSVVASAPCGTTMYFGLEEKILTRYKNQFSDTPYAVNYVTPYNYD